MPTRRTKYSAFGVTLLARDSQSTVGAQRLLLFALALRCDPDKGYSCFPSYRRLAEDTGCKVVTLRRAAKDLCAKGLIKRRIRKSRSNYFYINVALLQQQAAEAEAARKAAAADDEKDVGFAALESLEEDDDVVDQDEAADVADHDSIPSYMMGGR